MLASPGLKAPEPMDLPRSSRRQAAVRLLACINAAAEVPVPPEFGPEIVGFVESQMKLQALDFWIRYPDYLANELISAYEQNGDPDDLSQAVEILDSREPELRRFPMVRYLFGAFEPLDDALSLLAAYDFIRIRREGTPGGHIHRHLYLLTNTGRDRFEELVKSSSELEWYPKRAALVMRIAGGCGGKALKDRQYLQMEYSSTKLGTAIAPIARRVRQRLASLLG